MQKTIKATKLLIGAFLVALLLMVTVVLAGPGSTDIAEADGGGDGSVQFGVSAPYDGSGGGVQSMGVTWTGFD